MRLARKLARWAADRIESIVGAPVGPRTHDYTAAARRPPGHDYRVTGIKEGGLVLEVSGSGNVAVGDYLLFSRDGGGVVALPSSTTRYRVERLDMVCPGAQIWTATLRSAPGPADR